MEVVKHDKVCHNVVSDIPPALARFLGDVSGLAEFVGEKVGDVPRYYLISCVQVMFCRHAACWNLDLINNTWARAASLHVRLVFCKD